jgi:hypothetical protein
MEKITNALVEAFSRLTGKTKEEVLNLTKNADGVELDAAEIKGALDTLVTEKIAKVKTDSAGKALSDGLKKQERLLSTALGIESYTDFEDLTSQIKAKKGEGTASPELQKQNDKFKQEIAVLQKTVTDKVAEYDKKMAKFESDSIYSEALQIAKNKAEKLGLAFSTDPAKRTKQIEAHAKAELQGQNLKRVGKKIVFVDADGDILKDEMQEEITLDSHFEKSFLDAFDKATETTPAANGTPSPKGSAVVNGKYKFTAENLHPKKYQEMMTSFKGDKEQAAAYEAEYNKQLE